MPDLTPVDRVEQLLSGADIEPVTRLEHFLAEAGAGGAAGAAVADRVDVLEARVDNIVALPEGSTQGDAELMDIRVGANGVTYPTAGDAVRGQIEDVYDTLSTEIPITWNQLCGGFTRSSGTLAGVSYTKAADNGSATFNGTASAKDFFQLVQSGVGTTVSGHKYLGYISGADGSNQTYRFYYVNRDIRDYGKGVIWTAANSTANIICGIEFAINYVFNNLTVKSPLIFDLTLMFGAGNEPETVEEFRAMFPEVDYPRDTGTQRYLYRFEENALNIYRNSKAIADLETSAGSNIVLNVMTHNCGHFNYGAGSEYAGDDVDEKVAEWKQMIARNEADIIFLQEFSTYFDAAGTINAYNTLCKPLFPTFINVTDSAYGKAVSKIAPVSSETLNLTVQVAGVTYTRYTKLFILDISGVRIAACSVHFVPGYTEDDEAVRMAEAEQLITLLAGYDRMIIGGDFNSSSDDLYALFTAAGYSCANHGYFGSIDTLSDESVDNIIVKGFTFYNVYSNAEDKCTSDHQPLIAKLRII